MASPLPAVLPFLPSTDKQGEILSLFALSAITLKTYSIAATIR